MLKEKQIGSKEGHLLFRDIKNVLQDLGLKHHQILMGGSLLRGKETIGDLDIGLLSDKINKEFYDKFIRAYELSSINGEDLVVKRKGDSVCSILLKGGFLIEFKKGIPKAKGAFMLHLTGPAKFNTALRSYAKLKNYKLSEKGLFDDENNYVCGKTEREIFNELDLDFVAQSDRDTFKVPAYKFEGKIIWKSLATLIPKEWMKFTTKREYNILLEFMVPSRCPTTGVKLKDDYYWNPDTRQNSYSRRAKYRKNIKIYTLIKKLRIKGESLWV